MKGKLLNRAGEGTTYALVFETGDEAIGGLERFAQEKRLAGSHFTAIGTFSDAVIAWFDWQKKDYKKIPVREQVEVLVLAGDIALKEDGSPKVHAHVVLGTADGTTRGEHLIEAHVRPTLEVVLTESPVHLRRKSDPASGIALIHL